MPIPATPYPGFDKILLEEAKRILSAHEFQFSRFSFRGCLFIRKKDHTAILLDHLICDNHFPYGYTEYTKEQNALMHAHEKLFRFTVDDTRELSETGRLLKTFLLKEFADDMIRTRGANRGLTEVDPTIPEAFFEQVFIDCYGRDSLDRVAREFPVIDANGMTRSVDYYIRRSDYDIAIEKNGEKYHHPLITGKKRYKSQLVKQNSLVASGAKVFRWSLQAMKFTDNFSEEIRLYLGSPDDFILSQKVSVSRQFKLFRHQTDVLGKIKTERQEGNTAFWVVLPTGTGKTEILIADFADRFKKDTGVKGLVMVPSKQLKLDHMDKISRRLTDYGLSHKVNIGENPDTCTLTVQTYAWLSRHYQRISPDIFDYIAVDEAHHSMAPTVQKVICHFRPATLVGFTATDQRLDEKKLETVFGRYDTNLSLPEAIKQNLLSPIKAFRLKSNVDLSQVRYNGKDYMATDLQRSVIVPSRDQLIVDVLKKYFVDSELPQKQGVIFCVSVNHAQSLAGLMQRQGVSAMAVSGQDTKSAAHIEDYQNGKIQFLTTCSLLNEGWDSPQTSVIVMARPTMSKVLYTQQLGRGTRKYPGKEALYVIDVVDNYGGLGQWNNRPWSIHALLGISEYMAWGNVMEKSPDQGSKEEVILAGLYEQERAIEHINIFTFENQYPDHINDEQLARELFVSTGTVKNWVRKGKITPKVTVPLGRQKINYFAPGQVDEIIKDLNLKRHDDASQYDDFFEFIGQEDFSMSYKMVMLLSMLTVANNNGECSLDVLMDQYKGFYQSRLDKGIKVDRPNCPYANEDFINDNAAMKRNLLQNPFEKFERKRFMYHCKDLNHISFSNNLWTQINNPEDIGRIKTAYFKSLIKYYSELDGLPDESDLRHHWKIPPVAAQVPVETIEDNLIKIVEIHRIRAEKFKTALPFIGDVAAGEPFHGFEINDLHTADSGLEWFEVPERLCSDKRFLVRVTGDSMEPTIMKGDYLICEYHRHRQTNRDVVIMGDFSVLDEGEVAVKRISESEHHWIFKSDNPQYNDIRLEKEYDDQYPILGTVIYNLTKGIPCH